MTVNGRGPEYPLSENYLLSRKNFRINMIVLYIKNNLVAPPPKKCF